MVLVSVVGAGTKWMATRRRRMDELKSRVIVSVLGSAATVMTLAAVVGSR